MGDLVLGIDASTTAVKAIAFDRRGTPQAEARAGYPLHRPAPGHFEQDAGDWWSAFCAAVAEVCDKVGASRIAALAIGQQRETFVLLDANGAPTHPAILWLDERARAEVSELSDEFGRDRLRAITGKPPDPTPALYPLRWLKTHRPEALDNAALILDVHGYLVHRLTGAVATALAAADPLGIIDLAAGQFDPELVAAAGLSMDKLPELIVSGDEIGRISADAASACRLPAGVPVIAGAGDGQISGLGLGVTSGDSAYLSLGSGIITGVISADYKTADAYRTLASPTGTGFMLETVIRSGMQLAEWVAATTGQSVPDLESAAADIPPGADNLLCVPYFAGAMNPHWDDSARGTMIGLSLAHTPGHLYRAALEGLAFEQGVATHALETSLGRKAERFIACGGGLKSAILPQAMAAVLNRPIAASPVEEGVALGAAILAARGAGWFASLEDAVANMVAPPERTFTPDPALIDAYQPRLAIYREIHAAIGPLQSQLAKRP